MPGDGVAVLVGGGEDPGLIELHFFGLAAVLADQVVMVPAVPGAGAVELALGSEHGVGITRLSQRVQLAVHGGDADGRAGVVQLPMHLLGRDEARGRVERLPDGEVSPAGDVLT